MTAAGPDFASHFSFLRTIVLLTRSFDLHLQFYICTPWPPSVCDLSLSKSCPAPEAASMSCMLPRALLEQFKKNEALLLTIIQNAEEP